jgi:cyclophilin family peptidyl-prolyl cis-trans isomerase
MQRVLSVCLLCAACLLFGPFAAPVRAQKKPAGKGPAKSAAKADGKSDAEEWKRLITRKAELIKEFEKLNKQPKPTDAAARAKAAKQVQQLVAEFQGELVLGIQRLAPVIYEKDPTDPDAAEFLIARVLAQEGNSREAIRMADKVIEAGRGNAAIFTYKGIALFNTNDFGEAKVALEEARKADPNTFPQIGEPRLAETIRYIEYWKAEQARRAAEAEADDLPRVLLKTNRGEIEIELFENEAPNTVANFVSLVEAKKYDGIVFHRLEPGFVIQGGDLSSRDGSPAVGEGPGYTIACECYTDKARKHFQGSVSMAHAGRDTGSSQFFITHRPTAHLNYEEGKTMNNHTVFGRVIRGLDVALALKKGDKIETATVVRKRDHKYVPETLAEKRRRGAKPKQ